MKFLTISDQNVQILSVFITLLLRLCKGQLQPGEIKANSLPQIFHTLVLHHKVGFDQGGPAELHTLMTLWLGISPMCVDQVKDRHQCRNVALENTVKNMHLLIFSPFPLRDFNHRNFLIWFYVFL